MADERTRVVLKIAGDVRLVAAVEAAVAHFAERAGLDPDARADLAAAAEAACRETFPLLAAPRGALGVTVDDFCDRIEVTLEHRGRALPAADLDRATAPEAQTAGPGRPSGLGLLSRVDRVKYKRRRGTSRMTLVKYVRAHPRAR